MHVWMHVDMINHTFILEIKMCLSFYNKKHFSSIHTVNRLDIN